MSSEENKAIARRFHEEAWNMANLALVDELFDTNYLRHVSAYFPDPVVRGPEGIKQLISGFRIAFPDIYFTIEDQIAEGDKVMTRWTARGTHKGELRGIVKDIPPTEKQVTVMGIIVDRFAGGKFLESWFIWDILGLLRQLGAVSLPGQAESEASN